MRIIDISIYRQLKELSFVVVFAFPAHFILTFGNISRLRRIPLKIPCKKGTFSPVPKKTHHIPFFQEETSI